MADNTASLTRAELARADYQDWLDTFKPIEDELIRGYDNVAERERMVGEAQTRSLGALDNAEGTFDRRMRSLGMVLTPQQEAAQSRRMDLSRGLANVNAANMTRRRLKSQDQQLLTGMAPQGSALQYAQGI